MENTAASVYVVEDDRVVAWRTPRPAYMREIEPLAVPGAWDSPKYVSPVFNEAIENRKSFDKGKIDSKGYIRRAMQIYLAKGA